MQKLNALLETRRPVMSPVIEFANRLNPNFDGRILFGIGELHALDDVILNAIGNDHATKICHQLLHLLSSRAAIRSSSPALGRGGMNVHD
jgi:hypothetical protein